MVDGVSFRTPAQNTIYSCQFSSGTSGFGFYWVSSSHIISFAQKVSVNGQVSWTSYAKTIQTAVNTLQIGSNSLPDHYTGVFPTDSSSTAGQAQYHPDLSSIVAARVMAEIPANPVYSNTPTCIGGTVGIAVNGVFINNALDADGRDAVANEISDLCEGHPNGTGYHYHHITNCFTDNASGHSVQVGWALDGFGIYGPKGQDGTTVTNAQLDVCHGHIHSVTNALGVTSNVYHYHGNLEFPYTVGCFRGTTNVSAQSITGFTTPQNGFWYTSDASGRGYSIEVQGSYVFFAIYTYSTAGADLWYVGGCMLGATTCTGTLQAYSNGTSLANLGVAETAPSAAASPGSFSLTVTSASTINATITATSGAASTYGLIRYPIGTTSVAAAPSWGPTTGWYWSPSYSGTGWFVEAQGSSTTAGVTTSNLFAAGYAYGATGGAGSPNWYVAPGTLIQDAGSTTTSTATSTLAEYQNGPTLTGGAANTSILSNIGSLTIRFTSATTATLTLPNGKQLALQRFTF
ncbi:MAG: YHYH protein [Proteobacteria bacterium]|nr:YHYH protein [Pseudomonadota bacterium]